MATVVLSGSTGAIGGEIAKQLVASQRVAKLVLLCRDPQKGQQLISVLGDKADLEIVDLSSARDTASCAQRLSKRLPRIDVVINNAATVPPKRQETPEGLELQFALNVLSYHILMVALLPKLSETGGRVINVASDLAGGLDLDDLQCKRRRYDAKTVYMMTKQANRMQSWEAVRRGFADAGVAVVALMPGVVTSTLHQNLGFGSGFDSASSAAAGPVWLATEVVLNPKKPLYYHRQKEAACQWMSSSHTAATARLWDECEQLISPILKELSAQ